MRSSHATKKVSCAINKQNAHSFSNVLEDDDRVHTCMVCAWYVMCQCPLYSNKHHAWVVMLFNSFGQAPVSSCYEFCISIFSKMCSSFIGLVIPLTSNWLIWLASSMQSPIVPSKKCFKLHCIFVVVVVVGCRFANCVHKPIKPRWNWWKYEFAPMLFRISRNGTACTQHIYIFIYIDVDSCVCSFDSSKRNWMQRCARPKWIHQRQARNECIRNATMRCRRWATATVQKYRNISSLSANNGLLAFVLSLSVVIWMTHTNTHKYTHKSYICGPCIVVVDQRQIQSMLQRNARQLQTSCVCLQFTSQQRNKKQQTFFQFI